MEIPYTNDKRQQQQTSVTIVVSLLSAATKRLVRTLY